ncbi:MAG: CCA tRNA nucleotidyltransferase [Planctomycetota bacterium]
MAERPYHPGDEVSPRRHARHERALAEATSIVRTLREAGHIAYFAGGCVRDELLGLEPVDYDIATDARPERVSELFGRTSHVGAHFGVVLVRPERDSASVEVATFRSDGSYSDNRRPDEVTFSTPEEDAARRDFTVNALFMDPLVSRDAPARERVIDYVSGVEDLDAGVIRAVGDPDERLAEDHLRALRAVRFAARLGFRIDEGTQEAIRRHARELSGVSRERIGDEMRKVMADRYRAVAIWQLQYLGLDEPVLGEAKERALPRTLGRLPDDAELGTSFAALALDRGLIELSQVAGLVESWRERLCLSNQERDRFKEVLTGLGLLEGEWPLMGVATQKRAASADWFTEALRLVAARDLENMVRIRRRVDQLIGTPSGLSPRPLVDGDALIAAGHRPGPLFGRVLDAVYDAQLEDLISDRAQAMEHASRLFEQWSRETPGSGGSGG